MNRRRSSKSVIGTKYVHVCNPPPPEEKRVQLFIATVADDQLTTLFSRGEKIKSHRNCPRIDYWRGEMLEGGREVEEGEEGIGKHQYTARKISKIQTAKRLPFISASSAAKNGALFSPIPLFPKNQHHTTQTKVYKNWNLRVGNIK